MAMSGFLEGMDFSKPTWVNYGRVFIDIIMMGLLVCIVARDVRVHSDHPEMSIHLHEVPVYLKHNVDYNHMWEKAEGSTDLDDAEKLLKFQTPAAATCISIKEHPMCVCIRDASYMLDAKNCLLQHPIPSRYTDWNVAAVSAAMFLWFMASLATSVGTLPFINTYVTHVTPTVKGKAQPAEVVHGVLTWHRMVVVSYVLLTLGALFTPMIVLAIQFPGKSSHMDALMNMLMWSVLAMLSLAMYNHETITGYISWAKVQKGTTESASNHMATQVTMSVHNYILYVHLLVSAPAMAVIIHMNQSWTEYHTIVNTTLILSTIFAVDGFSAEMANYWTSKAKDASVELERKKSARLAYSQMPMDAPPDEAEKKHVKETDAMHQRLGLVRLFAWTVNAVMLLLLFSLAYPLEIDHQRTNSALFVVVVVMFAAVFLAPDLVREFTKRTSFNNIQFRLYGDFVLRCLVLFFTWRGSIMERTTTAGPVLM